MYEGGRVLLTEIMLPGIARPGAACLIQREDKLEKLDLINLSSMRVSNRTIPTIGSMETVLAYIHIYMCIYIYRERERCSSNNNTNNDIRRPGLLACGLGDPNLLLSVGCCGLGGLVLRDTIIIIMITITVTITVTITPITIITITINII